ncbi:hypothetical protein CTI12_AA378420 [Artemisia annua]|uniref:Uncharacterized protein n=1 Tax=Artemisia annua TaxID=35608 RepID=A0A2U1LD55_ARTAN|nr:hypothetical protein CTI12_AA378420 [Artemisia annua]
MNPEGGPYEGDLAFGDNEGLLLFVACDAMAPMSDFCVVKKLVNDFYDDGAVDLGSGFSA